MSPWEKEKEEKRKKEEKNPQHLELENIKRNG